MIGSNLPNLHLGAFFAIFFKELKHSLRDKDVLIYTVLIPCLFYPLLTVLGLEYVLLKESLERNKVVNVAVIDGHNPSVSYLVETVKKSGDKYKFTELDEESAKKQLARGDVDAIVRLAPANVEAATSENTKEPGQSQPSKNPPINIQSEPRLPTVEVLTNSVLSTDILSAKIHHLTEKREQEEIKQGFAAKGLPAAAPDVFKQKIVNLHERKQFPFSFFTLAFAFSIFNILLAGAYPAIAVSSEEFEKRTIESIFLVPLPPMLIVFAKVLSVTVMATTSGLINFVSMYSLVALTIASAPQLKGSLLKALSYNPNLGEVLILASTYVLLALLISASFLLVTSLCRSVRSAQNWVAIPLFSFFLLAPISFLPQLHLDGTTFYWPGLNLFIILRDAAVSDDFGFFHFLAYLTTFAYIFVLLYISRLFLFSEWEFPQRALHLLLKGKNR